MAAFVFQTTAVMNTSTQYFAHGLGTTPDYIICELTDDEIPLGSVQVIAKNATSFATRTSLDGKTIRATAVKIHSIMA
jgi:hypothetical protein